MALNVTFDGFCSLNDGTMSNVNVQYQAYFCKVGAGSSPSQWNAVRTVEASGYWNVNLGDGDWVGQDGAAAAGDVVVMVFWRGGDRMGTNCSVLDEWGAVEIPLTGASTYTQPTQVKENILPTLDWSFPVSTGTVGVSYTTTNDSDDVHTWDWSGTIMEHMYIYADNEPIYYINYVRFTHYDWDDTNQDNNLPLASTGTHTWTAAGDYTIEIVVEDHCGGTVTGTHDVRMLYPAPSPDIDCNQDVANHVETPDTVVTFDYNGTNPYSRITSIDWVIQDDTNTTTSGIVSDIIPHTEGTGTSWYGHAASPGAFTDPGAHNVAIVVYWNDGFDNQTATYDEDFIQDYFSGPNVDFDQVPDPVAVTSGVIFNNTTSDLENRVGTAGAGEEYDWEWNDEGNIDNVYNVPYSYSYSNIPGSDDVTVELCAHWNNGWDDYTECELKNLTIKTTVAIVQNDCYYELTLFGTSLDGTVSGYHWEIERSTTSGIAGPYELIWESPTDMDQKEKTIAFTEQNYFKVIGFVHGNGDTTDYEIIYVDTVCADEECTLIIWNGTGEHDSGGDWSHSGHGTEEDYAAYEGTNGLDATGFTNNKKIHFQDTNENNVDQFDVLSMQINLKEWPNGGNIKLYFEDGNEVNIINYLQTYNLNQWQRVLIPLEDFGLTAPINLKNLTMESTAAVGMYLDNVEFTIGSIVRGVIDVGRPDMEAEDTSTPTMKAGSINDRPTMRAYSPPINLG